MSTQGSVGTLQKPVLGCVKETEINGSPKSKLVTNNTGEDGGEAVDGKSVSDSETGEQKGKVGRHHRVRAGSPGDGALLLPCPW